MTTHDEEIRRTLSTLIAFPPAMPVVAGAAAAIVPLASEFRTTPAVTNFSREADPFPVEGLFEDLTSPGMTRDLLATAAEQSRAIRRVLEAVRYGTAVLPSAVLAELERVVEAGPLPSAMA